MKNILKPLFVTTLFLYYSNSFSQQEIIENKKEKSNIQQYTPSKLIGKGQIDLKWFNNLYTQTESTFSEGSEDRQTFFTSTLELYTGVGENKRWNVGAILEFRSNVIADRNALEVFKFDGESGTARSGLTSIAPSVKFVPFAKISNFSIQSSFYIPLIDNEVEEGVFLDQKGYTWQNRFFYDYTFPGDKWQLFSELNSEFHFGKNAVYDEQGDSIEGSFANNSLNLTPGLFLSYFPSSKFTVLALAQHSQRLDLGNNFTQDFTALGGGLKYQLTDALNIETLYTNFVRGNNTGLGETFNVGLRAIF
ncbi:transporter [Cellulophaga baltica]|uniref:transporter n=1 Tax=Cellulophaga TaxID=104264 RepID=UPI001C07D20C|nr:MULTISPECIES: transporter [Cellulophaga]MBU2995486.1 transporter [Cellulophaga baltica]MDO6766880.1 transporter [Cellulophaga sp. 1_MG-2023]